MDRHHTIVAGTTFENRYVASVEKDWFKYDWCELWQSHQRIVRGNHIFHVVSSNPDFPLKQAEALVDSALRGKVKVIDLRDFSVIHHSWRKNG